MKKFYKNTDSRNNADQYVYNAYVWHSLPLYEFFNTNLNKNSISGIFKQYHRVKTAYLFYKLLLKN